LHGQKGHLGHAVAAAGAIESVFCFLSIQKQQIPHIRGLKTPVDPALRYAFKNEDVPIDYMMKNGFVFGGINCTLLFKKYGI
jgi:3-oxoacyl-(acyl-carrier-protein) synthase